MPPYSLTRGRFSLDTDPARLQVQVVADFLNHDSYWAQNRPLETIQKSIQNSLCFGLYDGEQQIGFARVVTDYATFAWLCDVFVLDAYRGQGLGKWLVESLVQHPDLKNIRRMILATRDAHELYRAYGQFTELSKPENMMERLNLS